MVVQDVKIPSNLEFGQVLVKVYYSGICGAQINEIEAVKGPDKFLPHLLGHEGSGVVEKVGNGVTRVNLVIKLFYTGDLATEFKVKQQVICGTEKKLILDGLQHLMKKQ